MSEANGLPLGWVSVPLTEIVLPSGTCNPRNQGNGSFWYVDIEALDNTRQRIVAPKTILNQQAPSRARMRIRSGDVLFSLVRPYLKNIAVVPPELDNQVASTAYCVLRSAPGIESAFLFYQLVQESFIHSIPTYGSSPPAARDDEFLAAVVRIAPSDEQRRIVAKIDELFSKLDAGVAALERVKTALKRYRAAVLKAAVEGKLTAEWRTRHPAKETGAELLRRILDERRRKWEQEQRAKYAKAGRPLPKGWQKKCKEPAGPDGSGLPALPEGWGWATVAQIAEVQGGIQKQPKRRPASHAFPFLRVANVLRGRLDLTEVHRIELFDGELEKLRLRAGDLLIVEGNGSKTEIGRSALWGDEITDCVHQNHIIRVRPQFGSSKFLNAYWNSPDGTRRVSETAASTSGLYTLSVAKVNRLPVPLLPLVEQELILAEVERRLSVVDEIETQIEASLKRASRLRQSILKRAFEGRLVPQDPLDEPAELLLQKIRQQQQEEKGHALGSRKPKTSGRRRKKRTAGLPDLT